MACEAEHQVLDTASDEYKEAYKQLKLLTDTPKDEREEDFPERFRDLQKRVQELRDKELEAFNAWIDCITDAVFG